MELIELGERLIVSTGRKWERIVGYSRAVRTGPLIAVTGTVGCRSDGSYPESAGEQARLALATIVDSLKLLGAGPEQVFRTRLFVTDISRWEEIGRAHAEFFGNVRPATTMVQIAKLIDDAALVEIEADAWCG